MGTITGKRGRATRVSSSERDGKSRSSPIRFSIVSIEREPEQPRTTRIEEKFFLALLKSVTIDVHHPFYFFINFKNLLLQTTNNNILIRASLVLIDG